jgi:hypothetical protein
MTDQSNEYKRFTELVNQVVSVPRSEMRRREEEYQRQSRANPNRRGPKPRKKQEPASRDLDAS